jgi:hypothetical protein
MINITVNYNNIADFLKAITGAGYFVTAADVTTNGIRYTIIKKGGLVNV